MADTERILTEMIRSEIRQYIADQNYNAGHVVSALPYVLHDVLDAICRGRPEQRTAAMKIAQANCLDVFNHLTKTYFQK